MARDGEAPRSGGPVLPGVADADPRADRDPVGRDRHRPDRPGRAPGAAGSPDRTGRCRSTIVSMPNAAPTSPGPVARRCIGRALQAAPRGGGPSRRSEPRVGAGPRRAGRPACGRARRAVRRRGSAPRTVARPARRPRSGSRTSRRQGTRRRCPVVPPSPDCGSSSRSGRATPGPPARRRPRPRRCAPPGARSSSSRTSRAPSRAGPTTAGGPASAARSRTLRPAGSGTRPRSSPG